MGTGKGSGMGTGTRQGSPPRPGTAPRAPPAAFAFKFRFKCRFCSRPAGPSTKASSGPFPALPLPPGSPGPAARPLPCFPPLGLRIRFPGAALLLGPARPRPARFPSCFVSVCLSKQSRDPALGAALTLGELPNLGSAPRPGGAAMEPLVASELLLLLPGVRGGFRCKRVLFSVNRW